MSIENQTAPLDAAERRALDTLRTGRCRTHEFRGLGGGDARCDVAIATDAKGPVVMFSERDDNPGTSVTNYFEQLATEIQAQQFPTIDPCTIRWLERYPKRPAIAAPETVDRVRLTWNANAQRYQNARWQHVPLDAAQVARGR